ncbi:MAG TPA: secretin N-terminal domain-containing protein [Planctomycetota bacterium]|nr:secretin N-terminal domain-containing protein [Planctomycetota bacterium]
MIRPLLTWIAMLVLALPAGAQEPGPDRRLRFDFQDASVDAVLRTVSRLTGWVFVLDAPLRGTVTALSDAEIPVSRCLDFLNACLLKHQLFVLNPAAPAVPPPGEILRVIDLSKRDRLSGAVTVGIDPRDIPLTAEPRTQIIPLKSASAAEAGKDFGDIFRRLLGDGGQLAISAYANSILASGPSDGVRRVVEVLHVLDQTAAVQIKLAVIPLVHTDAAEIATTLNDVFKRDAPKPDAGVAPRLPGFLRSLDAGPPAPRTPATEQIRITPDPRTNSLIAGASEENMSVLRTLVASLDRPSAELRTYIVPLSTADAVNVAGLLNALWHQPGASLPVPRTGQTRSDGTPGAGPMPFGTSVGSTSSRSPSTGGPPR